jgi:CheY-like chemotaxis protein/HPt (histidine-containing phosphotransfer) domain-containing protein
VLVVDDNATNRQILVRQTESWGMTATETGSPVEALAWIREGRDFDVAILDMQMEGMDGNALARAIHEHDATVPLVMLTSLGRRREDTEAGVEFAAFLTKPIKPSQLYDALMTVFAGRRTRLAPEPPAADGERPVEVGPPLRILVAEDNVVNQQLALLLLSRLGYRADVASNGLEVLEAVERQPYDVVFMDVQMPEMDGLEATRRLVEREPDPARRPRVVAMTANAMQGDRELCLEAGMDDYVAKPIHRDELVAALGRCAPPDRTPADHAPSSTPAADGSTDPAADGGYDPAAVNRLLEAFGDDGPAFIADLAGTFFDEAPKLLETIRAGLAAAAADEVRRAAHSLKSNGAALGLTRFAAACKAVEEAARAGDLAAASRWASELGPGFDAARAALATAVADLNRTVEERQA